MSPKEIILRQLKKESASTKRILQKVPFDQPEWKPHDKSMTVQRLASHIAEIPHWMGRILNADSLDMGTMRFERFFAKDKVELMHRHQESTNEAIALLEKATEEQLLQHLKMIMGDKVFL
ncbi:MAG: DinB family protein [Chitinophagales bacterium]